MSEFRLIVSSHHMEIESHHKTLDDALSVAWTLHEMGDAYMLDLFDGDTLIKTNREGPMNEFGVMPLSVYVFEWAKENRYD